MPSVIYLVRFILKGRHSNGANRLGYSAMIDLTQDKIRDKKKTQKALDSEGEYY